MNRYTPKAHLAILWFMTNDPQLALSDCSCSWNAFPSTVHVHQPSGCLTNRMMKALRSDVSDCVSEEVKEQLFVKTMSIKETTPNIHSKNSDVISELPQNCFLIGWGQWVGSKWGLLELWLYKRHPISQERDRDETEREWEKGSPNLLLLLAVCLSKERKRRTAVQCIFEGKISAACALYNSFASGFKFDWMMMAFLFSCLQWCYC